MDYHYDLLLHRPASRGFFITGSDTEVGKTWVACAIIRSLRKHYGHVGAYKPVASGVEAIHESDAYQLWQASGAWESLDMVCPQSFIAPLAPPIAAQREQRSVDRELILQRHRLCWIGLIFWLLKGLAVCFHRSILATPTLISRNSSSIRLSLSWRIDWGQSIKH